MKYKSYKDISILQFQQLSLLIEEDNPYTIWKHRLSILTDMTIEYIENNLTVDEFKGLIKDYAWVETEQMPTDWVKSFTCHDEKFLIRHINADWTAEQFFSIANLTKEKGSIINNLHWILACLVEKRKGEKISPSELKRRAELFQMYLDPITAYPIALFQSAVLVTFSTSTQYYSTENQLKKLKSKAAKKEDGLKLNGTGITRLINFLRKGIGRSLIIT